LPTRLFRIVRKIGNIAEENGLSVYIVGGFVRDLLLGVKNLDLDIVVEGSALDLIKLVKKEIDLTAVAHPRFGTAHVTLSDGFKIDIASARKEHYGYAGSLPSVTFSSIEDDLFRRDFTINTLAIKINPQSFGRLLNLFGGAKDLEEKKIRVLHNKSFIDDPTRILRAIRFEQRYNFTIEKHTKKLLYQARQLRLLKKLSRFRIGDEIILILKEDNPLKSIMRLSAIFGLSFIDPLIKLDETMLRQFRSVQKILYLFSRTHLGTSLKGWLVYFMILTAQLNIRKTKMICRDFSLIKADIQKIKYFKSNGNTALKAINTKGSLLPHNIYQILHQFSYEALLVLMGLTESKLAKNRISFFLHKLSLIKIELTGKDLKRLKLKPGPKYKEIFRQTLYAKVNGKLRSKADEVNYVRNLVKNNSR
jgi:tRNA nucleotidyltransferase (CCA-adding enzyme)